MALTYLGSSHMRLYVAAAVAALPSTREYVMALTVKMADL